MEETFVALSIPFFVLSMALEIFLTRRVALHFDARGIVRQNVAGNSPEFTDPTTGKTTNTSGGFVGSGGILFYF